MQHLRAFEEGSEKNYEETSVWINDFGDEIRIEHNLRS
jgi:hypothetical protein